MRLPIVLRTARATSSILRCSVATATAIPRVAVRGIASIPAVPQLGSFQVPEVINEPMHSYAPGTIERKKLQEALAEMRAKMPYEVPCVVNGEKIYTKDTLRQPLPFEHKSTLANFHNASKDIIDKAIAGALAAKPAWEAMPFNDRAAIFLKAADLLTNKYRYQVMAATMLGQSKNAWQAEIDAAAELADFWRFNTQFASDIYSQQPTRNAPLTWNRMEYRALEGFVVAYSPFNFTAIGGNLVGAPALMGNVCIWKPSNTGIYSSYLVYEILKEAATFGHPEFAGFHFTGSTQVFKHLWQKIGNNINKYKSYPRIVGETGGKNMHFLHKSADAKHAALQTVRSAFEYNGQKCSACSRVYVPDNLWDEYRTTLIERPRKSSRVQSMVYFTNFMSSVINKQSFDKIKGYLSDISSGKTPNSKILVGGKCDDSVGYTIEPTVVLATDPKAKTMVDELFGPVVTVYVYPADKYEEYLALADSTSDYALTCGLFAQDRNAIVIGSNKLRNAAGNFYINDKSTGAVVGQQAFGGGRASGTNDKAGSALNLLRWVSPRTIKETFVPISSVTYPSNLKD
ncbi:delta-1-pyrroline-5-carboxylate dehydrogenase 1 [Rhizoclosmatium globosum]|uniref:Multifunctional fusion protein n=1 Tax=Rhizoclosmatium globosum TaxID=329046 RepID=A0A1Y2CBX0_9FUNG|nr:delta-1-pyrroline-5-carboxylate dehydrogenase 1 [Rhizoclosmatium globosum]|eukprot:ORY44528.1 delta-1-pyrroline-5-carboxylate dehydrogenase 1 [Rhizoclosmatium globosum]